MRCERRKLLRRHLAKKGGALPFFSERIRAGFLAKWHWMLLGGVGLSILGAIWGYWTGCYTATATLIRQTDPSPIRFMTEADTLKAGRLTGETLLEVIRSPEVGRRVASASGLRAAVDVARNAKVSIVPGAELLRLSVEDRKPDQAVYLLNLYVQQAALVLQELESNQVKQGEQFLQAKLEELDRSLELANDKLLVFQRSLGTVDFDGEI